jgi:FxsC-like protein
VRVGFIDETIELGSDWDGAIVKALQECPVMVSAYSPAYFNSQYCGKEWEFFCRRRERHGEEPPVIKLVIWIPLQRGKEPPHAVGPLQYYMGSDKTAPHNAVGLKQMRKQYNNYDVAYDKFIDSLADEILEANKIVLPKLDPLPALGKIDSAFHPTASAAAPPAQVITQLGQATPARRRSGPKFARFVFIAGDPNEFPLGARRRDFYLDCGGVEWKPYYPDTKPLMIVASEVAGNMNIISEELPFGNNLDELVRDVETARSLVILFVDGWTAELPNYKAALNQFDKNNYLNCSIFVPWNRDDPETAGRCDQLMTFVRDEVFPRWSRRRARLLDIPRQDL